MSDDSGIKNMLTVTEVAKRLGLTTRHITRLAGDGYFEGAERLSPLPGSPWRIPEAAVIEFEEQRKNPTKK